MRVSVRVATAAAIVCWLRVASAQDTPRPQDSRSAETDFSFGVGGFANDSSTAFTHRANGQDDLYWPGLTADVGYARHILPWLALGARAHWQYSEARDQVAGTIGGQAQLLTFGPYARFYLGSALRWRHLNPWAGVGVEPLAVLWAMHYVPTGVVALAGGMESVLTAIATTRVEAFNLPFQYGLEWQINDVVAVGVFGTVEPWIPYAICSTVKPGGDFVCSTQGIAANTYFSGGINTRVQLPW